MKRNRLFVENKNLTVSDKSVILKSMLGNLREIFTLIASAALQYLFYRSRLPDNWSPQRILVVKLDHLGDILLATPVFSNLRRAYPNAELHALIGGWSRVIVENHPAVNKVIEYNSPFFSRTGASPTPFSQAIALYRELRRQKYDVLIELRSDWRIICFAFLRVAPKRIERATLQIANFLHKKLRIQRFSQFSGLHETARNLDVLKRAGIPTPVKIPTFQVTTCEEKWAFNFLKTHGMSFNVDENAAWQESPIGTTVNSLVAIHPGSPVALKRWKPERYAELADWLIAQKRAEILFVGTQDEIPIVKEIQKYMREHSTNLVGKTTFQQLASILRICHVFIGNDSAPMHLAAAVGIRTIGLYGPSDPARFGPVGPHCETIQRKRECRPCLGTSCRFGIEGCISEIQVSDVMQVFFNVPNRTL